MVALASNSTFQGLDLLAFIKYFQIEFYYFRGPSWSCWFLSLPLCVVVAGAED